MVVVASSEVGDDNIAGDLAWFYFCFIARLNVLQVIINRGIQVYSIILGILVNAAGQSHV